MRWIFLQRFNDGIVLGNVDDLHFLGSERHDLTHGREGEWLESPRYSHFAVAHFGREHFGCEHFLVELIAELQRLDVVK